ncbi:hypothetical protein [Alteromonas sp. 5E99-2]|uniref:hypothetical protein n=1 Tax=Alteromonas sp. 5E99-2 TaxID=2817683 RepID=UPI001F612498|nr:hypothetical protein [Alteromonas sp. 5E99-2]
MTSPDLFNNYILSSPSVWFDDFSLLAIEPIKPTKPIGVYVAVGSLEQPKYGEGQDMLNSAKLLTEKIEGQNWPNLSLKSVVINDATHSTSFPTSSIQGLYWFYGKNLSDL